MRCGCEVGVGVRCEVCVCACVRGCVRAYVSFRVTVLDVKRQLFLV